jgi:hypothetical protein
VQDIGRPLAANEPQAAIVTKTARKISVPELH